MTDKDILDKLASAIKKTTANACAECAKIYRFEHPANDFERGYNRAISDIVPKIRQLGK